MQLIAAACKWANDRLSCLQVKFNQAVAEHHFIPFITPTLAQQRQASQGKQKNMAKEPAANSAEAREKNLKLALSQIEKEFGKGSIMRLGDKTAMAIPVVSSAIIVAARNFHQPVFNRLNSFLGRSSKNRNFFLFQ